jgi:Ca-activated chloride channel family protein
MGAFLETRRPEGASKGRAAPITGEGKADMHRTARSALWLACVAALLARAALADGILVPRPVIWPGPRPRPRPMVPPAIKYHKVTVTIKGRVATTHVDQVFRNLNRRPMEADYIFPIPERAAIDRFTLDIDGKEVPAELLDAKKARKIYEDIVRRQKDPALLEYAERGMFRARVFPIPPGGERRITLRYDEEVPRTGRLFAYRYPLNTEKFSSRPIEEVSVNVSMGGDRGVRSVICPSHPGDAKVLTSADGTATVKLLQKRVKPDKDFVLYYGMGGDLSVDVVAHRPKGKDGYFMLAISPPVQDRTLRVLPKDLVVVVDTSGSMAGQKLRQVKNALRYVLNSIERHDRFGLVRFSTEAEPFRTSMAPATRANVAAALEFVDRFKARGGTAIEDAWNLALEVAGAGTRDDRPLMIAFLTDGQPTIGERDPESLLGTVGSKLPKRARVFVFGVGNDLNTKLLDRLAETGRGRRTYVAPSEDVELAVSSFYDRIARPVLTDLKIVFDASLDVRDVYPKRLGDLFSGDEIILYGRYRGGFGTHAISLRGRSDQTEERFVFEAGFPGEDAGNGFIARLWATRKIGYLLDQMRQHGESEELKKEVVSLSREFGVLTPYTSMLVVEDEARPGRGGGNRPTIPPPAARPFDLERRAFKGEVTSGQPAVDAARELGAMQGGAFSEAKMLEGLDQKARESVKHLEDKTFYLRDGVWWDSTVDMKARRTKVTYLSDRYFALLRKHAGLGRYFALGSRVVVAVEGRIYEVQQ